MFLLGRLKKKITAHPQVEDPRDQGYIDRRAEPGLDGARSHDDR